MTLKNTASTISSAGKVIACTTSIYLSKGKWKKFLYDKRYEDIDFHLANREGLCWVKCLKNEVGHGFIFHAIIFTMLENAEFYTYSTNKIVTKMK